MSACCITPANSPLHASPLTRQELVAESGVSPDDLLVMSQPSLVPAPSPHQDRAVRFELTMTGFADRRLNQLGYARCNFGASCGNRTRAFALARRRHSTRPTKPFEVGNWQSAFANRQCLWCWRKDSNLHQTGFEPVTSTDWVTPALNHASRFTHQCLVPAEGVEPSSTGF